MEPSHQSSDPTHPAFVEHESGSTTGTQGKKMNGPLFYLTLLTQIARWNFSKDATTRRKMEEQDRLDTAAPAVDLTMDQQTG